MNSSTDAFIRLGGWSLTKPDVFRIWIAIFHMVGAVGLYLEFSRPYFQALTPFHLLMCAGILLYFHGDWSKSFLIFLATAFGIGMAAEIIGVQTGLLFGEYVYGPVLGTKVAGVPLIIGVNWIILAYASGILARHFVQPFWLRVIVGSTLMVALDVVIEPVAVALDFWAWGGDVIPLGNYVGWFFVAGLIQAFFHSLSFIKENAVSTFLFLNLFLFFLILSFLL